VGLLGPVAVLTHYHNQTIAQQLIRAVQEFFEENKATLHGAVTYPHSAKHLALFHKFGYRPKSLTAMMSRALDRPGTRPCCPSPPKGRSRCGGSRRWKRRRRRRRSADSIASPTRSVAGWISAKEVEIVDGLALGDTLLLERGADASGSPIYHTPGSARRRPAPST
jgi:hypothetical protein